jgi:AP2-associated kinase
MPGQPAHGSAHAQTQAAAHAQYAHAHAQQMAYAQAQAQQQAYYAQQGHAHAQAQAQAQQTHPRSAHKGTIPPGHVVRVGAHSVRVERYLSEGGYAHVYLTTSEQPIYPPKKSGTSSSSTHRWGEKGYTEHCLKRIAFEDDKVWADVSKEIEVMVSSLLLS